MSSRKAFKLAQPEILDIEQVKKVVNATFTALREIISVDKQECRIENKEFRRF